MYHTISIKTQSRNAMVDITGEVQKYILESNIKDGLCVVYVPHTTAGITINEGADPDVCRDLIERLGELVPFSRAYHHIEGNADAHIKATLVGSSVTVFVEAGRPVLGTWQRIFFCEFDGPRTRKALIKLLGSGGQ